MGRLIMQELLLVANITVSGYVFCLSISNDLFNEKPHCKREYRLKCVYNITLHLFQNNEGISHSRISIIYWILAAEISSHSAIRRRILP